MFKAQAGLLLQRLGGDVLWFIIMFAQVLWDTDRGGEKMGRKIRKKEEPVEFPSEGARAAFV